MALTGRRPAEIFFSASFPPSASLRKNSPIQPSSSTASSKPAKLPVPAPSLTQSPSSPTPRNLFRPSTNSGPSKASLPPTPLTPPPAPSSPSTFPPPSAPSHYPGNPATCEAPTAPSVATALNLRTRPTISSSPKSSDINSWGQTHPFPWDRVIRIFMFESPEPFLLA
jgi:hypothetical protein